jgi:hypothetical protein
MTWLKTQSALILIYSGLVSIFWGGRIDYFSGTRNDLRKREVVLPRAKNLNARLCLFSAMADRGGLNRGNRPPSEQWPVAKSRRRCGSTPAALLQRGRRVDRSGAAEVEALGHVEA